MKARNFAFVLITFVLSACSSPEPPEIAIPDTAAPAKTDALVATEKPSVSTETPAQAELQLEIVDTHIWSDELGQFQADALFRNPYDFPVSEFESYITFFDGEGKELLQGVYFDPLDGGFERILPGETVPAVNCLWCSNYQEPNWESYEIIIRVIQEAPVSYSKDIEVMVDRFTDLGGNYFELGATVENTGGQTLHSIYVSVIVRDQDGNFVGTGESTIYTPEGSSGFEPGVPHYFLTLVHASLVGEPVLDFVVTGQ